MDEENKETSPANLFWPQAMTSFWSNMLKTIPANADAGQDAQMATKNRFLEQWQTNLNLMKSYLQMMNAPENTSTTAKSMTALPEIILKMAKSGWDASFQLQKNMLDKAGKIGQRTEAYNFDNLDHETFRALADIYEKEFRPYLQVPPLGLMRFFQERFNTVLDKKNIFEATIAEFLSILYIPMEKASKVLQEKIEKMTKEGTPPKEAKEVYNIWIKILEGHYMNLFKTDLYLNSLHSTLNKLEDFLVAKDKAMRDFLMLFPVPTNQEMDDLYKEFHLLKKRVKELEKKVKSA